MVYIFRYKNFTQIKTEMFEYNSVAYLDLHIRYFSYTLVLYTVNLSNLKSFSHYLHPNLLDFLFI